MSARIDNCYFDLLSDPALSEDALKIALNNIISKISPIHINKRFEIDFFSSHMYALYLIFSNPNAGDNLKTRCFKEMVDLNRRLHSIRQQVLELENEVKKFEQEHLPLEPTGLPIRKLPKKRTPNWAVRDGILPKKVCVNNYTQALAESAKCLNLCETKLPNTPEAQLLKLLR